MIPNIFDIATKELHQDAFIVWLLQWADPKNEKHDPLLFACGQDFVKQLISKQYTHSISLIREVEAGRQCDNIDVWAKVKTAENNYFIIIEDKTFTTEHSNQLTKYREIGLKYSTSTGYKLICIYLKTGSEPLTVLKSIEKKNFAIFDRIQLKNLMNVHPEIENNIFVDFRNRLNRLDQKYEDFEKLKIKDWDSYCWIGFYQFLEIEFSDLNWSFVNPPGGKGFWNAYFIPANSDQWEGHSVYLQIEQKKLCIKINTGGSEKDRTILKNLRNELGKRILKNAEILEIQDIQKPKSPGTGNAMTVAVIESVTWFGPNDSIIDKYAVVNRLKKYRTFLDEFLSNQLTLVEKSLE